MSVLAYLKEVNAENPSLRPYSGLIQDLLITAGAGITYFAAAILALYLFATHETPSAIWPATGALVALVLIVPRQSWPGIFIGVFVAGTLANWITGKPLGLATCLGITDVLEGLLAGLLLNRFIGKRITFSRLRELTGLVLLSALLSNGLCALLGALSFASFRGTPLWTSWYMWWLSNAIGILTLTPCIVSWSRARVDWFESYKGARIAEALLVLSLLSIFSVLVFGGVSWPSMALAYVVFPLLIWSALRFGVQGASLAAVAVSAIAVWYTAHGYGPFAVMSGSTGSKLLQVQAFIGAGLACSLVPATVISERKEAEEKLRKSEMQLSLAHDIAGVGSFLLDPSGRNSWWSEQMFRIMGREASATPPPYKEFLSWIHPEDREMVQESFAQIFQHGSPFEIEFRYICPNGSWKYVHAVARREIDRATSQTVAVGTVMDMTERRKMEEQLRQAQKMEAVGRLAGGVAHDFNNLLGVIIGYTELVLGDLNQDDPLRKKVEPISQAAVRAASLTSQLLAFSRRQVLKPEELDLNQVVKDIEPMLKRIIGEEVEITTDLQPLLPVVKADPGQMDQVILNLAVNSRDAMPSGGKLRIRTSRFSCRTTPSGYSGKIAPGEYVMLTVSDTGHGMDAATKAHIFEPFFTTKQKGKGTGLGLATVYGIISQSNGHIWAESEVGKGTDINVVLPVVRSKKKIVAETVTPAPSVQHRSATVLLVEDEDPLRDLISRVVRDMGCTVVDAATAEEAIQIARERDGLDVLLTDVVMPKMNGLDLARKVAELQPAIKVLYMSGYSDNAISEQRQVAAVSRFLQKPFTPTDLREKLLQVIDASEGAKI